VVHAEDEAKGAETVTTDAVSAVDEASTVTNSNGTHVPQEPTSTTVAAVEKQEPGEQPAHLSWVLDEGSLDELKYVAQTPAQRTLTNIKVRCCLDEAHTPVTWCAGIADHWPQPSSN